MPTTTLDRITRLLAKAESTDSRAEADALIAKAQQLATTHAVDLAVARQAGQRARRREEPVQRTVRIGVPRRAHNARMVALFAAIAHVNDVVVDVARDSTWVQAYGFVSDLDVVDALHASVATQMVADANAAIARGDHRNERVWSPRTRTWRVDARVYRGSFYDGFVAVVAERLRRARDEAVAAAETDHPGQDGTGGGAPEAPAGSSVVALALVAKTAEIDGLYRQASEARGTWRGPGAQRVVSPTGRRQGTAAGRRARLRADPAIGGGPAAVEG